MNFCRDCGHHVCSHASLPDSSHIYMLRDNDGDKRVIEGKSNLFNNRGRISACWICRQKGERCMVYAGR
jgi:hypothetical protein